VNVAKLVPAARNVLVVEDGVPFNGFSPNHGIRFRLSVLEPIVLAMNDLARTAGHVSLSGSGSDVGHSKCSL
jgi:hypothetical protein